MQQFLMYLFHLSTWHPTPEAALAVRAVVDLVRDEGVRMWVRWTARVLWTRALGTLSRYQRRRRR
ncbi:hypothetical protein ACFUJY_27085 [Streptomyces sp. NPDC057249]|uniref:hypothetical protein n=1 Tax=Streptomyces sp. NPDC057249 TaxID=3346067 RepID=UPI00362BE669